MSLPWLKLYRQIDRNVLYFSEPFDKAHAWIDLLILANDSDGEKLVGLSKVEVKRGDVLQSYDDLARRWKWSKTSVARFIEFLVSENMVSKKRNGRNVTLSIVKYEFFQGERKDDVTITERLRNDYGTIAERSDGVGDININKNNNNRERRDIKEKENNTPNTLTGITPKKGDGQRDKGFENEFEEVWKKYPKKNGKASALKDYIKARKNGVARETIETGLDKYIDECARLGREKQYIADGSTWFHQSRWDWDYDSSTTPAYEKPKESFEDEYFNKIERWKKEGLWNG